MQFGLTQFSRVYMHARRHRLHSVQCMQFVTFCKTKQTGQAFRKTKPAPSFPKAKKSYGQNFLKEGSTAWEIVQGANLQGGAQVLEIGPGTGILTAEILKHDVKLTAIENDHGLMVGLKDRFSQEIASGQLNLLQGDATRLNVRQLLEENGTNDQRWNVLANLPFNITTEVLKILLPMGDIISEVHVMLQFEAAQRLAGKSEGDSDYRAMSALVQFYSTATPKMIVSRVNFQPQPHVDCQMVNFLLKRAEERLDVPSEKAYLQVLKVAFSSRRKTLQNNLKAVFPSPLVSDALQTLGLNPNIRPQELSAPDFAALTRFLFA